jgi:hypothetical protein
LNSGAAPGYSNEQRAYRPGRYNGDNKTPPVNYICHRCSSPGHFINNCPTNGNPAYDFHKVKKATGIPRAFLKPVEGTATVGSISYYYFLFLFCGLGGKLSPSWEWQYFLHVYNRNGVTLICHNQINLLDFSLIVFMIFS